MYLYTNYQSKELDDFIAYALFMYIKMNAFNVSNLFFVSNDRLNNIRIEGAYKVSENSKIDVVTFLFKVLSEKEFTDTVSCLFYDFVYNCD